MLVSAVQQVFSILKAIFAKAKGGSRNRHTELVEGRTEASAPKAMNQLNRGAAFQTSRFILQKLSSP